MIMGKSYICSDLLQGCQLLDCSSCLGLKVHFNFAYDIILKRFQCQSRDIVTLIISMAYSFHKCAVCGFKERLGLPQFDPCEGCKSTYYCSDHCQLLDFIENSHENVCYQSRKIILNKFSQ